MHFDWRRSSCFSTDGSNGKDVSPGGAEESRSTSRKVGYTGNKIVRGFQHIFLPAPRRLGGQNHAVYRGIKVILQIAEPIFCVNKRRRGKGNTGNLRR